MTVGSYRRLLTLPSGLASYRVAGARVEQGELQVRFEERAETVVSDRRTGPERSRRAMSAAWPTRPRSCSARSPTGPATTAPTSGRAVRPRRHAAAARDANEHIATGGAECTYCPICRTVHVVRQASPEVRVAPRGGRRVADAGRRGAAGHRRTRRARPARRAATASSTSTSTTTAVARGGRGVSLACGIDVGGTKIAGGVVDDDGNVLEELRVESPARRRRGDRGRDRRAWWPSWPPTTPITAVGVGAAGYVDKDRSRGPVRAQPRLARRRPQGRARAAGRPAGRRRERRQRRRLGRVHASAPATTSTTCCWSPSAPASAAAWSSTASSTAARSASPPRSATSGWSRRGSALRLRQPRLLRAVRQRQSRWSARPGGRRRPGRRWRADAARAGRRRRGHRRAR